MSRVDVTLTSDELHEIKIFAKRQKLPMATAIGMILGELAQQYQTNGTLVYKERHTITMKDDHLDHFDKLARSWGMGRSEAARRLLNYAIRSGANFEA